MPHPKQLDGFFKHGVQLVLPRPDSKEARGKCHICGEPGHLYVNSETLLWHCKHCGEFGNFPKFLGQRQVTYRNEFLAITKAGAQSPLAQTLTLDRKLELTTFHHWNFGWDGNSFTIGADGNVKRTVTDVRFWSPGKHSQSSPSGRPSESLLVPLNLGTGHVVWVCEGEWDGMAMWEILHKIAADDLVLSIPGASIIPRCLATFLLSKQVRVVFDKDSAGFSAASKFHNLFNGAAKEIKYVHWPGHKQSGYDLRDAYQEFGLNPVDAFGFIAALLQSSLPGTGVSGPVVAVSGKTSTHLPAIGVSNTPQQPTPTPITTPGTSYRVRVRKKAGIVGKAEVDKVFKKWFKLDTTEMLDVFFGAILANRIPGDPIWLFIVAPPGGMKSEMLMSISKSPTVENLTSLTPATLISGATIAGGGDPSLLARLDGRILSIKDFTAIMSLNPVAIAEILGTLRDVYDGESSKTWGTGLTRRYACKFGITAGVTPVIESSSAVGAMLGERFLKYNIPSASHLTGRQSVLHKAMDNIPLMDTMRLELSDIGLKVLDSPYNYSPLPKLNDHDTRRLIDVALWAATLRGVVLRDKFTKVIQFKPTHEIGTRLARQLCKLAYGISIYKRDTAVSDSTFATVCQVARDSIPQITGEIIRQLFVHEPLENNGGQGTSSRELVRLANLSFETVEAILNDLALLKVVTSSGSMNTRWQLSQSFHKLMSSIGFYQRELAWFRRPR